jgi:hypothetical protein
MAMLHLNALDHLERRDISITETSFDKPKFCISDRIPEEFHGIMNRNSEKIANDPGFPAFYGMINRTPLGARAYFVVGHQVCPFNKRDAC